VKTSLRHEGAPVAIIALVALNGIFLSANGLFMLAAPRVWYDFVPGVTDTGFFNQHFIRDIGIIQLFLGVAFIVGLLRPERRIGLWVAATLWLSAHALLHLWEVAVGICAPSVHTARFSRRHPARAHRHRAHTLGDPSLARRKGGFRLRFPPQPIGKRP
jgi:hypothetical protein